MNAWPTLKIVTCRRLAPILMVLLPVLVIRDTPVMERNVPVSYILFNSVRKSYKEYNTISYVSFSKKM